jgi:tocopherol O-methyltransferase
MGLPEEDIVLSYAQDVVAYFDSKTAAILERYGPGPRVHYHTGLVDQEPPLGLPADDLRHWLVAAQERMLFHAAEAWNASSTLTGDLLDVGCGLGGGAIFWAQEYGARVTAVTCVPSHAEFVTRFAVQAGVGPQVNSLVWDAPELPGESRFDAVVAIDSSGYLPRRKWFQRVASLLRAGGCVFVIDCFLASAEYEAPFNRHWRTRIGTIAEYLTAAQEAGLRVNSIEDLSHRTAHFWTATLALIRAETQNIESCSLDAIRRERSLRAHALVRHGLQNEGLRYAMLNFSKPSSSS